MFDDLTAQIQSDELSVVINYNDRFDDPRYVYEE